MSLILEQRTCHCGVPLVNLETNDRLPAQWYEPTMTVGGPEAPYYRHTESRCHAYRGRS